jgi:DNA polymerase
VKSIIDDIQESLRFYKQRGCSGFECSKEALAKMNSWGQPPTSHHDTLERILADARDCRACAMSQACQNRVFGEGDPSARLMFVGKAPGPEEDAQGKPFAGPAGELLTKIIKAMQLTRSQVYLCNIMKCGPFLDSPPRASDINTCYSFLKRQINVIKPEFICTLGSVAVQTLLRTKEPLSGLRGRFHDFHGITLMPTYAPGYLLLNEDKKRDVWEDMKKLMKAMER